MLTEREQYLTVDELMERLVWIKRLYGDVVTNCTQTRITSPLSGGIRRKLMLDRWAVVVDPDD